MKKIVFKYKNEYFLFASFKRASSDYSFLWWFERSGKSQSCYIYDSSSSLENVCSINKENDKKKGISYHTTGCIHYKKIENNPKIFSESLFKITQPFCFAIYSIPSVPRLDKISKNKIKDYVVIELGDDSIFDYRITFDLIIAPYDYSDNSLLRIDYKEENFSVFLSCKNSSLLSANFVNNSFVLMRPSVGLFERQQQFAPISQTNFFSEEEKYNEQWALVKYHQKINCVNELIVYDQDSEYRYRMIFVVPMRIAPKIEIIFEDIEQTFKIEEKDHKHTHCLFTVLDKNGVTIKNSSLVKIKHISLDAEL